MKILRPLISVSNRQRRVHFDTAALQSFLDRLANSLGIAKGVSVVLVSDRVMRRYNREFAGKNQPTDVLSFPNEDEEWELSDEPYAGDILISIETAQRQQNSSLMGEVQTLALHGILHLLGYDHENDNGQMARLENRLRKEFGLS